MIKIPNTTHTFAQTNQSDLFGNIHYTKNINFDESGYLKLSPRTISLINAEDDTDFNLPTSFGRYTVGEFYIATIENPYIIDMEDAAQSSVVKDTDNGGATPPAMTNQTRGAWWQNRWHITNNTKLYYKTVSSGDWTDTGIPALTTGVAHPLCAFEKQGIGSILVGNGNEVIQLATDYSTTNPAGGTFSQLTISSDYEVVDIAYNNALSCIITRMSQTAVGQNKNSGVFIWDGSASSANYMFDSGSDTCISITPYKSSFVILTRSGRLLYFNGGGFDEIGVFPVYTQDMEWANFLAYQSRGRIMSSEGDLIFINISNIVTDSNLNSYYESMIGGVWVYDPAVGLYHRYSPSVTKMTILSCRQVDVDVTTNTITVHNGFSFPTSPTIPTTGNPVKVTSSTIGGLVAGNIYYIIKSSPTTFKLASTYANAIALIPIDLTSTGGSFSYFMTMELKDYGQSKVNVSGATGLLGGKVYAYERILFGTTLQDTNSTTYYQHLDISVAGFKNIGYFITPKLLSDNIEDNILKGYIKYRPLKSTDNIQIKYKNKDFLGLPSVASCTATSSTVLTTTSLISEADTFTGDLECEVIAGAGAGQMVKVTSITESSGTYTITLDTALDGVSASDKLDIKLDNWTLLTTIDNTITENWKEFSVAKASKWTKFKVILTGSNITVEELQIINKTQLISV